MGKNSSPEVFNGVDIQANQALIVPTLPKGMKNSHINSKAWVKDSAALYQAVQQLIDNSAGYGNIISFGVSNKKSRKNQA